MAETMGARLDRLEKAVLDALSTIGSPAAQPEPSAEAPPAEPAADAAEPDMDQRIAAAVEAAVKAALPAGGMPVSGSQAPAANRSWDELTLDEAADRLEGLAFGSNEDSP